MCLLVIIEGSPTQPGNITACWCTSTSHTYKYLPPILFLQYPLVTTKNIINIFYRSFFFFPHSILVKIQKRWSWFNTEKVSSDWKHDTGGVYFFKYLTTLTLHVRLEHNPGGIKVSCKTYLGKQISSIQWTGAEEEGGMRVWGNTQARLAHHDRKWVSLSDC